MDNSLKKAETSLIPSNVRARIVFQCYLLSLGITLMVLSIIAYVSLSENIIYIRNIVQNWNTLPIKSIRQTQGDCLQNEEYINHYIWPGINQGCDCRDGDQYIAPRRILFERTDELFQKECNDTMRDAGCEDIDEMGSRDFKCVPVEFGTKKLSFCGQREQGNNSFAQNSPKINECKVNELKCGTVSDYFYCTKEKECPIFQIKNNLNFQLGTQDYFQILRENDYTLPLVEFKIAQGDGVCRKVNDRSITSGRSNYDLISDPGLECERDSRFKLIYKFNEYKFFQANDALDIAKQAPGYEISSQYQWGLYGRHYINFTLSCRKYQQEFIESIDVLEDIDIKQLVLMIISIICLVLFIILFILNCCTIKGVDLPCIKGKGTQESNTLFCIQAGIKETFQLIQAIIAIISFSAVNTQVKFYSQLIDEGCSDVVTLDDIQTIRDVLEKKIYNYNLAYIVMFFIGACIDLIVGLLLLKSYYQERKKLAQIRNQEQQQDWRKNNIQSNPDQEVFKQENLNAQFNNFQYPPNFYPQQQQNIGAEYIQQYPQTNYQQQQQYNYQNQPIQNQQFYQNPIQN
ncbi:unnamed protein product (macronuclear) [Paramecium tetraurelia]|uniref:Transmembrane protein n=1 Tax=Paramecium tetraurelia TaxID=5888 RepID=A0EIP6_PARTE|nr:uncharacterized protein GSPATT00027516001 [Paramecium tetraurelia]CAK95187.1 unnamed protein product [Paramecium tetraurelia]|eukprot:XP_001462560.1 hypothetical protein (macronuclear) [Paramecium tetraurelia strain d4-2]